MDQNQLVIIVVAVLGVSSVISLLWVISLQHKLKELADKLQAGLRPPPEPAPEEAKHVLLAEALIELEKSAKADIQTALDQAVAAFSQELSATSARVSQSMEQLSMQSAEPELAKFRTTIEQASVTAGQTLGQIEQALEQKRDEFMAKLSAEAADEKEALLQKFDAKISDVVGSFLLETLGQEVDLGAQSEYIFKALAEHKAALKEELAREL